MDPIHGSGRGCDVFVSSCGSDPCRDFVDVLSRSLVDAGIRVFCDDGDQSFGGNPEVALEAIDSSRVCIPIFSRNYASSERRLLQLATMVERNTAILPIFCNVTPGDVSLETRLYVDSLDALTSDVESEGEEPEEYYDARSMFLAQGERGRWEEALRSAGASRHGWELKDYSYDSLSRIVLRRARSYMRQSTSLPENFPGMDDQVEAAINLLDIEVPDVRFLLIHGMGGIGKTTLAKVVYNQISHHFDESCFLGDVRETLSRPDGLQRLQDVLLSDLLHGRVDSYGDNRVETIKAILCNKKVLLVLDDVNNREQIVALAGSTSWFATGSRIIVTSRDRRVGDHLGLIQMLEIGVMRDDQALQLFSMHAFNVDSPPADYLELSRKIVSATGNLPWALEVSGSFLRGKRKGVWKAVLDKHRVKILDRLKLSYTALDEKTKQIFLDIACFFVNRITTNAMYMWSACGFDPEEGLETLTLMSLVRIEDKGNIWMHTLLRDLGSQIVYQEDKTESGNCRRMSTHDEAMRALKKGKITGELEALSLSNDHQSRDCCFTYEELKNLKNLRFLEWDGVNVVGDLQGVLPNLRWLSWYNCPPCFRGTNLELSNLVVLDLSMSSISEKWVGWSQIKVGVHLKVLDLTSCHELIRTPNLLGHATLERLILENCTGLRQVDSSIGQLKSLKHLNLRNCDSLQGLPEELCSLDSLEEVLIKGCYGPFVLPKGIGNLKSLRVLEVIRVRISRFPKSICKLVKLECLNLSWCLGVSEIPESFGDLKSLVELNVSFSNISRLPNAIANLKELRFMKLTGSPIKELSATIGDLEKLEELHAGSTNLTGVFPGETQNLLCLRLLDLSNTQIQELPSLSMLSCLKTLDLKRCDELRELPRTPASLTNLYLSSHSLKLLPDLSALTNLVGLKLSADVLPATLSDVTCLQFDFRAFTRLDELELSWPEIKHTLQLPSKLSRLTLGLLDVKTTKLPNLSHLQKLTYLEFCNCSMGSGFVDLGVQELEKLHSFKLDSCEFSELSGHFLPKYLKRLVIKDCKSLKNLCDLSSLEKLEELQLGRCEELVQIQGLGNLESLEMLRITHCSSLRRLENLLKLEKLGDLDIIGCDKFVDTEGDGGVKSMQYKIASRYADDNFQNSTA